MGAPGRDAEQGLTLQQLQLWRPLSLACARQLPLKGEPMRSINRRNSLTKPPSFRDQFSNWSWESVLLTLNLVFSLSQGDADCHVARPSLLAMTGQLSLQRRFRHCREALPLLGEVPSAHTGERGRRSRIRAGGKRQNAVQTFLFSIGSLSAMATPQSPSVTAPLKGAPRA